MSLKYSRQREAIKSYLCSTTAHPTADTVYMHIREQFPHISLGTVYRNLSLLVDLGEAQRLTDQKGTDHFDADVRPHTHFVCSECSSILDLPMELDSDLDQKASRFFGGEVSGHNLYFYGRCEHCLQAANH